MRKYFGLLTWAFITLGYASLVIFPQYFDESDVPIYMNVSTYGEEGDYKHVVKIKHRYPEAVEMILINYDYDYGKYYSYYEVHFNSDGQEDFLYKIERLVLHLSGVSDNVQFVSEPEITNL